MADTADKIVSLIESLLPDNGEDRPAMFRAGPKGLASGAFRRTRAEARAEAASYNKLRAEKIAKGILTESSRRWIVEPVGRMVARGALPRKAR